MLNCKQPSSNKVEKFLYLVGDLFELYSLHQTELHCTKEQLFCKATFRTVVCSVLVGQ